MRKLATLTIAEDKAWVQAFNLHFEDGETPAETDQNAWEDMKKEFPRLASFEGIAPEAPAVKKRR